jgi:hypothetical protein
MAVAFDAGSVSHAGVSASQSEASFSWTHTPAGTPAGVVVFVIANHPTNGAVSGVTYGGEALAAVPGGSAADTLGELGRVQAWFLGSGVPTGAQTVQVTRGNDATILWAVCATVTTGTGTAEVYEAGVQVIQENAILTQLNVDDGSPGTNSLRFAGAHSGETLGAETGANSTQIGTFASAGGITVHWGVVRETTAGQGARPVGFADTLTDDTAAVFLAVIEVAAVSGTRRQPCFGLPGLR